MKPSNTRFLLPLSVFVILIASLVAFVPVHASSAGPDTIVVTPSSVSQSSPAAFSQDIVISYSHNAAGAFPKTVSMQYVVQFDTAVIDIDNSVCTASTDGSTYCGVTAGPYAQMFAVQQLPQNNPCGANFCANEQPVSGTTMQIFVASIAALTPAGGIASAGGTHSTIHWKVIAASGATSTIHFSPPDTFYSTSSTSAIDPSNPQIFYTPTDGSYHLTVAKDNTSTGVVCASPILVGGSSHCTATVTDTTTASNTPPGGMVNFVLDAGTTGGHLSATSCTVSAGSCGVDFVGSTGSGTATVTGTYAGDSTHNASPASAPASITVNAAAKDNTSISVPVVTCSIALGGTSCTVPVTAAVADTTTPSNAPTGTVTFTLTPGTTGGSLDSPTCTLSTTAGVTSCSVMFTGTHGGSGSLSAGYGGDGSHNTSNSPSVPVFVLVVVHGTSTSVACSPGTISPGGTSNCAVAVADLANGAIVPTGSVSFVSSDTRVGTVAASCTLAAGRCSVMFTGVALGTATVTGTYGGDPTHVGSAGTSNTITVSSPTGQPVLLTFQGRDLDDFDNGVGQLQVFVNGHLVVDIPAGQNHLSGTGDFAPNDNEWVNFGPFDITSFVVRGQNTIVFRDPLSDHFGLVKNVTIVQGSTTLLHVPGARAVFPDHSVTFTFSIPPLVVTGFTVSALTPAIGQSVTFTATYTGGTAPFKCIFRFGDDESAVVTRAPGTCSVVHDYDDSDTFNASVAVMGASTSDRVTEHLSVTVAEDQSGPGSTLATLATQTIDPA